MFWEAGFSGQESIRAIEALSYSYLFFQATPIFKTDSRIFLEWTWKGWDITVAYIDQRMWQLDFIEPVSVSQTRSSYDNVISEPQS